MSYKAFEIVPVSEKVATGITCLECSGTTLFVGTACSFVIQLEIENGVRKISHNFLGTKKPVEGLKALSALNRLLAFSDGALHSISLDNLEGTPQCKVKGLSTFCINENPTKEDPFSVELCLGKRKQLQLYNMTEAKLSHEKDIGLAETPLAMAMDGVFVCVALSSQYVLVDALSGTKQMLFPYEGTVPLVKRISKEEFLLNGPSALGMFVTTAGVSQRPPLPWMESVRALAYSHPYVVCLSEDCLVVYSMFDQQPKQRIPFRGATYLDNLEGKLLLSGEETVYALHPIPWEIQVQALLSDKRVPEALELARHAKKDDKELQEFYRQAGFVQFREWHFEEARELFQLGHLDVEDLLSLYPRIYQTAHADVEELCAGDPELLDKCHRFLMSYLESVDANDPHTRMLVDTALVKLYAGTDKLMTFLESGVSCDLADCVQFLLQEGQYHAAASLYAALANYESALQLWLKLLKGDLKDDNFLGLSFYAQFLARLDEEALVWRYVEPALEKDQLLGVQALIQRTEQPDTVLELLHRFPEATIKYLEHLVSKIEKEKYHTLLAVLYMEKVLQDRCCTERKKLQLLLMTSSCYRVQLVLGKALENDLHEECAILYGKLQDHDKALSILVHQLKDYEAAEEYCRQWGREGKCRLYHGLLAVYICQQELLAPAIELLNSQVANFDAVKALQVIPETWSVATVEQFLGKAVRSSLHRTSTSHIARALARGQTLRAKCKRLFMERTPLMLTEDRVCAVCGTTFAEVAFAWCPDGSVVHLHCSAKR